MTMSNTAIYRGDIFNFTNGHDLWEAVCWPGTPSPIPEEDDPDAPELIVPGVLDPEMVTKPILAVQPTPDAYPAPVIRDDYNLVSGYYLSNETSTKDFNASDIAVLFVPTFGTSPDSSPVPDTNFPENQTEVFSDIAARFVQQALKQNKTKIVIDLSGNGGGVLISGLELFKIFFPQKPVYLATRFRTHTAMNLLGTVLSSVNESSPLYGNLLQAQTQVTPDQEEDFSTWDQFYGPHEVAGANLSTLAATFNLTRESDVVVPIWGYGRAANKLSSTQPFAAENILIMLMAIALAPVPYLWSS